MIPIGIAKVQPDTDPPVAEIRGAVIAICVAIDQHGLFLNAANFDQQSNLAVPTIIDRDISEFLAADNAEARHAVGLDFV